MGKEEGMLFYHGDIKQPLPVHAKWSCILFGNAFVDPTNRDTVLEINPFVSLILQGNEQIYLWVSTQKGNVST